MNSIRTISLILLAGSALTAFAAAPQITHLDKGNTLVRLDGNEKLLILPVQETKPDSKIRVLVNGKAEAEFYVRLADTHIDYEVPFDITPYKGKGEILLDIKSETGNGHPRKVSEFICWDKMRMSNTFDTGNREKFRPAYHHTPLYGWMNDPNGMFYKDGEWHLCYQWNPYGSKWQNMTWGHSKSSDLINWQHVEPALTPDGMGTIFSGNAAVDHNGSAGYGIDAVILIYTGDGINQLQNLAYSNDNGASFTKHPGNPVIATPKEARDPNMFFNHDTGKWNLVLASALDKEMLVFSSDDLKNWTLESSFGKGYGAQEGVWECPDLFKLPVDDGKTQKWVLLCNLNPGGIQGGSATQYFVGEFDGKTFTCDTQKEVTKWMDYGKDHYATVSWNNAPDNRHVVIGWMSNWEYANEVPTLQYRSANTLPRDVSLFRAQDGEIYLASAPSPELLALRGEVTKHARQDFSASAPSKVHLPALCEIVADLDFGSSNEMTLTMSNADGEKVDIIINRAGTIAMDRTKSGISDFSDKFATKTTAPLLRAFKDKSSRKVSLRIFVDRSSIELFANDGKTVMTNLVFPNSPYSTLQLSTHGGKARIENLEVFEIAQ